ncbi:glycosyltransferase family 2 protein [Flavisericum labens]|uniref:glycosyltransferase family 2 protein n=1 Tax=Flavisericum labens TaxID=3377112 RepID=UPI00387B4885
MGANNHLVSIVTACYNSEKYISETINSVLNQTYQNWELLLVDDCSSDNTVGVITKFQNEDKRIKVFLLNENSGAAVSRNKAIKEAQGDFIAFLDSDDKWQSEKLEKHIGFMLDNGYNLSHTSYELIDGKGKPLNKIINAEPVLSYQDMLYSNKIGCLTAIYNQTELGKVYMPLIRKRQDYGLWLKILKTGEKAYGLKEVLSQYRKTEDSMSRNKLNLIKWNWKLFREVENLSFLKSAYYLVCNVVIKLKA